MTSTDAVKYDLSDGIVTLTLDPPSRGLRSLPVDTGVPLPLSLDLRSVDGLSLRDSSGRFVPIQVEPRARWAGAAAGDSSRPIRWLGLQFIAQRVHHAPREGRIAVRLAADVQGVPAPPLHGSVGDADHLAALGPGQQVAQA